MNPELIRDIIAGRCILFIGPHLNVLEVANALPVSFNEQYCTKVSEELDNLHIPYDPSGRNHAYYLTSLLLSSGSQNIGRHTGITDAIYRKMSSQFYNQLAKIPFNTIINFGYDHLMDKALRVAGYEYHFAYYDYRGSDSNNLDVDKDMQLLYNLYGSVKSDPNSVVRTETEQIEFLRKINSGPTLPNDLIARIKEDNLGAKSYIFLGFDFNEWPYRFLLDTLQIPVGKRPPIYPDSQHHTVAVIAKDFYARRFGVEFMNQHPKNFIDDLTKAYKATLTTHEFAYISCHPADDEILKELLENLESHKLKLRRHIKFFNRTDIKVEENIVTEVKKNLNKATIYILIASSKAVADKDIRFEIEYMLKKRKKHVNEILLFPVKAKNSLWNDAYPELEEFAAIVLPTKDTVLVTSVRTPESADFINILNIINSKIR